MSFLSPTEGVEARQTAQFALVELSRNLLLFVNFLHILGNVYFMMSTENSRTKWDRHGSRVVRASAS